LIPVGYGLNCEDETAYAFNIVGAKTSKIFLKDLTDKPKLLENYHILAMIGGFSFGDHIAAGKVLANIYKFSLGEEIQRFIESEKLIFGECNGFQTLIKTGILPGFNADYTTQRFTLTYNDSGIFEDRWVKLRINPKSKCIFTHGIREIYLPVRHGEGKFIMRNEADLTKLRENEQIVMQYADEQGFATVQYPQNPNGSVESIAGICDPTGRIFGKMPHASAYLSPYNHPNWTRQKIYDTLPKEGEGIKIFRNAVEYASRELT